MLISQATGPEFLMFPETVGLEEAAGMLGQQVGRQFGPFALLDEAELPW